MRIDIVTPPYIHAKHTLLTRNQHGTTLVLALVFVTLLILMGSTAVTMTSTDALIGGNYHQSQTALHDAEAGIHYALGRLPALLRQGTVLLDGQQPSERYTFMTPDEFAFDIDDNTTFTRVADTRKYVMQVTGRPWRRSPLSRNLEVVMQRRSALPYGIFGHARVTLPASGTLLSYNSSNSSLPTQDTSSGQAVVGSNGMISVASRRSSLHIDGSLTFGGAGHDDKAVLLFRRTSTVMRPTSTHVMLGAGHEVEVRTTTHIAVDPLRVETRVNDAGLAYLGSNNNTGVEAIADYRLRQTTTLTAGNYYLDELTLGSGDTLTIDAQGGNVNIYAGAITITQAARLVLDVRGGTVTIYLDGPGIFGQPHHAVQPTVIVSGPAANVRLFSASDAPLTFAHHGDITGLVYAPFAPVVVRNRSGRGKGLLWAHTVDLGMNRPFTFAVDTALQDAFLSANVTMVSWKERTK